MGRKELAGFSDYIAYKRMVVFYVCTFLSATYAKLRIVDNFSDKSYKFWIKKKNDL